MSFTTQYGNGLLRPVTERYLAIALTEDTTLTWPVESEDNAVNLDEWLDVTPDAAGWDLTFPDATLGSTGFATIVTNLGASSFTVKKSTGATIQLIAAGEAWLIWLKDNSTAAGDWGTLQIGSTTSVASANALAGLGLTVIGLTLNQSHPVWNISGDYTIIPSQDRARLVKWTTGAGTISFPASATLGDNFFTLICNQGSASVTLDPNGAETIDGNATKAIAQGESCFVVCDGSNLFTVGYGRSIQFTESYLNKNVAGSANITLSSTEFSANIHRYFGVLTGNIDVIVPANVHQFIAFNDTTGTFSLTVKVSGQPGIAITQGETLVLYCNGTDVAAGNTSTVVPTGFFSNGTVASPSISFSSDTDTGFYRFAANTIGVAAGGVNAALFNTAASAVNSVTFTPAATGSAALISTYSGTDTDVGLNIGTQGAGVITLLDAVTCNATLGVVGNFAVNTNKFTVDAATGNSLVAGTLAVTSDVSVNTNKFTVAAASGNTVVAGTLGVTGAATFSSTLAAGASTLASASVTGAATVGTTLGVSGVATLASTVISGAATVGTTLGVTGASTLAGVTAASVTFSTTSGIIGTTTNDSAVAGSVGEQVISTVTIGASIALNTSNVPANMTSISLSAGDWEVEYVGRFLPANTTVLTRVYASISTTSATQAGSNAIGTYLQSMNLTGDGSTVFAASYCKQRISIAGVTTIYAVAEVTQSVSTSTTWGTLRARRVR